MEWAVRLPYGQRHSPSTPPKNLRKVRKLLVGMNTNSQKHSRLFVSIRDGSYVRGLNSAASRIDQRWTIQPSKTNQRMAARQNCKIAMNSRPCSNCPKPGIKKL